jgi:hypothetical protein
MDSHTVTRFRLLVSRLSFFVRPSPISASLIPFQEILQEELIQVMYLLHI